VAGDSHWQLYLPLLVGAFVAMLPFMILAEKTGRVKLVFAAAVGLLGLMQIVLAAGFRHPAVLLACLFFFFMAFNLLEANLPSLVSKFVRSGMRGTANGIYSTSQFAGAFLGGSVGGAMLGWGGPAAVFASCAVLTGLWLLSTRRMATPRQMTSIVVSLDGRDQQRALKQLVSLPGVAEVDWLEREQAARLTVDKAVFRHESIAELDLQ
jgi:predicted MFS family arabinose efflux permease